MNPALSVRARLPALLLATVLGAVLGVLVTSALARLPASPPAPPTIHGSWDSGSFHYLGAYGTAQFWLASRDRDDTLCLIADDPTGKITGTSFTCSAAEVAQRTGLKIGAMVPAQDGGVSALYLFTATPGPAVTVLIIEQSAFEPPTRFNAPLTKERRSRERRSFRSVELVTLYSNSSTRQRS